MIEAGVAAARAAKAKVIVAMGGGAVIDAGKAIAALVPARLPMMDHLEVWAGVCRSGQIHCILSLFPQLPGQAPR